MELFKKEPSWLEPVDEEVVDAMKKLIEVMQSAKDDFQDPDIQGATSAAIIRFNQFLGNAGIFDKNRYWIEQKDSDTVKISKLLY